jgi:hypothetical protein
VTQAFGSAGCKKKDRETRKGFWRKGEDPDVAMNDGKFKLIGVKVLFQP